MLMGAGLNQKLAAMQSDARTCPQDHPCRHGRLLRVGRAARRSGAEGQAGGGRRRAPRRGHGGELRGAAIRRALGDAVGHRQAPLPRADLRQAALRRLSRGSQQIRAIFADYTDLVEPLSLDEAYLDVTEDRHGLGSARAIAEDIRRRIREETGLTASAGVSYCKFIAKLASDQRKPDGLCVITPEQGRGVRRLAAGRALPRRRPGDRARRWSGSASSPAPICASGACPRCRRNFGSSADWYWRICRGIDEREVKPDRPYKSVSAERTFDEDLRDPERLAAELERIAGYAWDRVERAEVTGRTVTLKVKFGDFTIITRSKSFAAPVPDADAFAAAGQALARGPAPLTQGYKAARPWPP